MQIVHADEVDWFGHVDVRDSGVDFKRLIQGDDLSPNNFEFSIVKVDGRYTTPKHRHNFDQVRFMLSGAFGYGGGQEQQPGTVGYFPEGVFYQQDAKGESYTLLLQTSNASKSPYMSFTRLRRTVEEMKAHGEFKSGIYTYVRQQDGKKVNQDAFEAAWEYATGLEVRYPRPRYDQPIIMTPANFDWVEIAPGLARKRLGVFAERDMEIGFMKLDAGAGLGFDGARQGAHLFYVLSGEGSLGEARWRAGTALHLGDHDAARLVATSAAELYYIRLPTTVH